MQSIKDSRVLLSVHNRGASHPNYSGGEIVYGKGWNEDKKEAVRERDGFECQVCGKSQKEELAQNDRRLSVHHIINARKFDDPEKRNDMDNLVTLCHKHHMEWEGIPLQPQTA